MRFLVAFIMLQFVINGFGQNVDLIKKANLFDENRGYTEETGEEIDTEKEIKLPANMPVLDGIVVIGNYKRAIFTYYDKDKKRKVSAYHSPGEKFADASLKEVTPDYVILVYGGKQYKLYPDTKLKAKKTGNNSTRRVMNEYPRPSVSKKPAKREAQIVSRKPVSSRKHIRPPRLRPGGKFAGRNIVRSKKVDAARSARVKRPNVKRNIKRQRVSKNTASNPFGGGRRQSPPAPKGQNRRTTTPF